MTDASITNTPAGQGARDVRHTVLVALTIVILVAIAVQFALAGYGAFTDIHANHKDGSYDAHQSLGYVIAGLELVLLVLTLVFKAWGPVKPAAVAFVLAGPVQPALANAGHSTAWVGGLHALNGFLIAGATSGVLTMLRRAGGERPTAATPATGSS
jgi:cytochrome b561